MKKVNSISLLATTPPQRNLKNVSNHIFRIAHKSLCKLINKIISNISVCGIRERLTRAAFQLAVNLPNKSDAQFYVVLLYFIFGQEKIFLGVRKHFVTHNSGLRRLCTAPGLIGTKYDEWGLLG